VQDLWRTLGQILKVWAADWHFLSKKFAYCFTGGNTKLSVLFLAFIRIRNRPFAKTPVWIAA